MSDQPQYYNVKILRIYVAYLRNQLNWSIEDIKKLFAMCGSEMSILQAEDNWFDQTFADSFYNNIVEMTGDFDIAYKVGSFMIHESAKGIGARFISSFLNPTSAYKNIGRIASLYSKGATLICNHVSRQSADIHVKLNHNCSEREYQCQNRLGMLEALTTVFGIPKALIKHERCRYKGADRCEYHISWVEPKGRFLGLKSALYSLIFFLASVTFIDTWVAVFLAIGMAGMSYSLLKLNSERGFQYILNEQIDALHIALQTNERRHQEALLVRNINKLTNRMMSINKLCTITTRSIRKEMNYDRVTIFTVDIESKSLRIRAYSGFNNKDSELIRNAEFNLENKHSQGFLVKPVLTKLPIFIPNVSKHLDDLSDRSRQYIQSLGINSLVVVPIVFEETVFGVLTIDNSVSSKQLTINDLELLKTVTQQIAVAFSNDLTLEKLQTTNETLEQRVAERTHELAKEKDKANSANEEKSRFLAHMSHEIRTPLTSILGFADILKDKSLPEKERVQIINTISTNGKHLLGITSDILDLSKIEANKLEVEKITVSPLSIITEIEDTYRPLIEKKGLAFNINVNLPQPKIITTDPMRIRQILYNLLNNALKFTEVGNIVLSSRYDSLTNSMIYEVVDTGIGISEEQSKNLFTPFMQADASTTRKYGGTGLGLSISKRVAELLGGNLVLKSSPGMGSCFSLRIHCETTPTVELIYELQDETILNTLNKHTYNWDNKSILLAEDSVDIQKLIFLYLKKTGVNVHIVNNGQDAFNRTRTRAYDLILMDIQMPLMDGFTASKLLREHGCITPIIALSANAMPDDQERYKQIGINAFVAKPININSFLETLSKFLEPPSSNYSSSHVLEDMDLYADIIKDFVDSLPIRISELKNHVKKQDYDKLRIDAHNLKGLGGSFGYPKITEIAGLIEKGQDINKNIDVLDTYYKTNIRDSIT